MDSTAVMHEGIILNPEKRSVIDKIKAWYKEKMIDTGKAQDLEKKIDSGSKLAKTAIKVLGAVANVILTFTTGKDEFGDVCKTLASPELEKLVDVATETEKKALIGAKRFGEEAMGFGTQGVNPNVENGYTKVDDLIKDAKGFKASLDKYNDELDKIEANAIARREAERNAALANTQQEQLVPMEIEEDGPKMSM